MLLRLDEIEFRNSNNARCVKIDALYSCDHCKIEYVKRFCKTVHAKQVFHFCSNTCQRKALRLGGVINGLNRQRSLERYGTESPTQSTVVKEKIKTLCQKRHGVDSFLNLPHVRSQSNSRKSLEKRHLTMKNSKAYGQSKIENAFANALIKKFGSVDRQVCVNGWAIDFYVKSIDTYVQFDGVYWHGLDRSLQALQESQNSRDRVILRTRYRDLLQNDWFREQDLRLVRVTDKQFLRNEVKLLHGDEG